MANNNHFDLTLDTLAPQNCSITRFAEYTNKNDSLTLAATGASLMKVWFDTEATPTEAPSDATWEAYATSYTSKFAQAEGTYYYHVIFRDDVNNDSDICSTGRIMFETTKPVVSAVAMSDQDTGATDYTNSATVNYTFTYADGGTVQSGVAKAVVSGDIASAIEITTLTASGGTFTGTLDLTGSDGTKTISVTLYDNAGNVSDVVSASIELDTDISALTSILLSDTSETATDINGKYINYHAVALKLQSADTDIYAYKIWEGDTEPDEWVTSSTAYDFPITKAVTLSDNDGVKTVHAKVKDKAGSVSEATAKSVTIDTVKPEVSIDSDVDIISNVKSSPIVGKDYTTAVLTLSGTDALSGVQSWDLLVGSVSIKGSATDIPATYNLTSADKMIEGSNTITLTVTDKAGNTNSATVDVILDTTAPTDVSIATLNTWYKDTFAITASATDTNTVSYYVAWTSVSATDTTIPSGAAKTDYSVGGNIPATNIKWDLAQSAANYMHLAAVDVVGNVAYAHAQFGYDNVAPETPTIKFDHSIYGSTSANVTITYDDATSKVAKMKVTGDITDGDTDWVTAVTTRSVTLTDGDGYKNIYVQVKDNAENVSEKSDAGTCELDTSSPSGTLTLFEADGTTTKAAKSAKNTFTAHITYSDDTIVTKMYYKLYGDYKTAMTDYAELIYDTDKKYMTISGLECTDNTTDTATVKTINLIVKDEAGNESPVVTASFIYDPSAPVVTVTDLDHNRISKIHVERTVDSQSHTVSGYSDEVKFSFTVDDEYQAYKVCAYADSAAATAVTDPSAETAIPTTAGSTNMSASGLSQKTKVDCLIKGTDFESALNGGTAYEGTDHKYDGAHIVVVYAQNTAGKWSAVASFAA